VNFSLSRWIALSLFALVLLIAPRTFAYTVPPMTDHVTDTAGKLAPSDRAAINAKLEAYRVSTTIEIAVFIPATLDGESIEDVGIAVGRAWHIGAKGKDNGVVLVIAPVERKARIEVGKGVEGALTDLQSNDIIRQKIRPNLTPGSENYFRAVDDSVDSIMSTLTAGGASSGTAPRHAKPKASGQNLLYLYMFFLALIVIIFIIVVVRVMSRLTADNVGSTGLTTGGSNDGGVGSRPSSGGGGSSGGGDSGGGGFSGGGGDFGGGGSSDSF
jgi:uncharacterized protein